MSDWTSIPLLPCPFCGGSARIVPWPEPPGPGGVPRAGVPIYSCICRGCGVSFRGHADPASLARTWNRRVPPVVEPTP